MKKIVALRKRINTLIEAIREVPSKHRTPAMQRLLTDLERAAAEYDNEQEGT